MRTLGSIVTVALLTLLVGRVAAQVDSTIKKAPAIRALSPAILREIARYAVDTPPRGPALPMRILIQRPAWAKDSLLAARWVQRETPPQQAGQRLTFRPIRPISVVPLTPAADTTLRRQASPDWRLRAHEIARLGRLQPQQIHPQVTAALITQLDSVGVNRMNGIAPLPPSAKDADREDYSEYVIALNREVIRLQDAQAVRAVALAGLGTSQEAERFVAAQGAKSLPILDTAFALSGDESGAVVTTWAHMLAASPSALSPPDSVFVYGRILHARWSHPIPFLYAVRIARLFELRPIVDSLTRDASPATAGAAKLASQDLEQQAASATAGDWVTRLRLYVGYVCAGTLDARRQACSDMVAAANGAAVAVRSPAGRPRLEALLRSVIGAADRMLQTQGITESDRRMLESTTRAVESSPR